MKNKNLLSKFIITYLIPLPLLAIEINQEAFEPEDGFTLNTSEETIRLGWEVAGNKAFIEFQFIPRQGNTAAAPLIKALGINDATIMEDLNPNYLFWVGDRDLTLRDGWEIFFDRVPTRPCRKGVSFAHRRNHFNKDWTGYG